MHDAILSLAGRLDPTMGGQSVRQFTLSPGVHVTPVVDYTGYDWASPGSCRRAVYRFVFRTLPDPFYDALDSADASAAHGRAKRIDHAAAGARALNNPFVLRQCEPFAARLRHASPKLDDQIRLAFLAAFGRIRRVRRNLAARELCSPARAREPLPRDHQ